MFSHWLLEVREEPQLFDYEVLKRMVSEHLSGRQDLSLLLWRIWFFKLWYRFLGEGGDAGVRTPLNGSAIAVLPSSC